MSTTFQPDKVQLIVGADTRGAINQLGYLQAEYKKLEEAKKTATTYTQEQALNNAMSVMKEKIEAARKELGVMGLSQKELNRMIAEHNRAAANSYAIGSEQAKQEREKAKQIREVITAEQRDIATIRETIKVNGIKGLTTQQLINYSKQLQEELMKESDLTSEINKKRIAEAQEVNTLVGNRQDTIKGAGGIFSNLKGNLLSAAVGGLAGGIGAMVLEQLTGLVTGAKRLIDDGVAYAKKRAKDISDIQTTLTVSKFEASKIYADLGKIDTTRSRDDLKELVLVAGDLNEEVKSFVPVADKLEKVFERDFGGIGEASTMVAKLKGEFSETKNLKTEDAIDKIGSSIKKLNEAGPATTKGIVDFVGRIGQLPDAIKPGITDMAALAAVMEEANLTAEISSGGVSNILLTASKEASVFAKQFRMSKDEFQQFLAKDPMGFLKRLAIEVKGFDESKIGELFKTLKIESQESVKVIGVLSDNLEKFANKQNIAKQAFAEGTRLDEIFAVFNNDTNAQLTKAEKRVEQFTANIKGFFGAIGTTILVNFARILPDAVSEVENANKKFEAQQKVVGMLDGEVKRHIETIKDFKKYGTQSGISQDELKTAIDAVAKVIPSAITSFDNYGNALDINTDKAEKNILKQRTLMRELKNSAIDSNKQSLDFLRMQQRDIKNELKTGSRIEVPLNNSGMVIEKRLTDAEIQKRQEQLKQIQEDIKATEKELDILEKGFSLGTIEERRASRRAGKTTTSNTGGSSGLATTISEKDKKDAERLQEEIKKNEAKLIDEIVKMKIDMIDDENDRKKAQLHDAYLTEKLANEQLVKDKKLSQSSYESWVKAATDKLDADVAEINKKAREKQEKADLEAAQATAKLVLEAKLAEAEASGDELLILQTKIAIRKQQFDVDIEKATAEQKLAVWEKYLADVQKMQSDADYKTGQNEAKGASKLANMIKKGTQEYIKELDKSEKLMLEFGKSTQDALFSIVDSRYQRQEMRQDKSLSKQQKGLEKQLNDGLITEDEYEKRKTAIEKRHELEVAKIRRKQAIAEKANALASIAINTAIGASKVLGQTGMFGIPAVAFVIAQGAMQAATVLAQPLPALPSLFSGGWTPDEWQVPVNDGKGGGLMIGHKNEFMLNARATSSPVFAAIRPILESANAGQSITSMSGGGAGPVGNSNSDIFSKLTDAMLMNSKAIIKLENKLDDLKVRLAPPDIEYIGEEINYQSGINDEALITNSKL